MRAPLPPIWEMEEDTRDTKKVVHLDILVVIFLDILVVDHLMVVLLMEDHLVMMPFEKAHLTEDP